MSRLALLGLVLGWCGTLWAQPFVFVDGTRAAGLERTSTVGGEDKRYIVEANGCGAAFFDYDNDGWLDLYVVDGATFASYRARSGPGNALYRNRGDGTFAAVEGAAGAADRGWGVGVAVGDVDNDGYRDLYVTNYGPNLLYQNRQGAAFADITAGAGVGGGEYSASAAFFDYDNDGDLDLYVVNYVVFDIESVPEDRRDDERCIYLGGIKVYCGPQGMEGAPDLLYRNDGGTFTDVTEAAGIAAANRYYGLGVVPIDYDGDGDQDLFVANDETANVLFANNGDGTFADVAPRLGVAFNGDGEPESGMGIDAGDFDGDGDPDFYVTNFYRETNTLYRNDGGHFTDGTDAVGLGAPTLNYLGWGTSFFDGDNDGDLDLFVANGHVYPQVDKTATGARYAQPNQLFANKRGRFVEVGGEAGPGLELVQVSRGTSVGDYDNDGDVDLFVTNLNDRSTLLRNDGAAGQSLLVRAVGRGASNRDGVGAKVEVRTAAGSQHRQVGGGSGYLGHNDIRLHFGLGTAATAQVQITWPDGAVEKVAEAPAGHLLVLRQGQGHQLHPLGDR